MRLEDKQIVLALTRKALDNSSYVEFSDDSEWEEVLRIASSQGMQGLCLEALEMLPDIKIPQQVLLQWIGLTELQRKQYEQAWRVACMLDKLWAADGIHATVLKGRSIARYYPVAHHRFSCDLDVFIGDGWERACELLEAQGVRLVHEVYKEVEFTLDNVYVECHRYITPLRGNKHLKEFERYLRSLLDSEPREYFEGTTLVCPPLMFTVMLYIEHALGDLLHGHLTLKHIVDWGVLRKQTLDWNTFETKCKEFKFERFVALANVLADVVEGKKDFCSLPEGYREAFDEMFQIQALEGHKTWFQRRVQLLFGIVRNTRKFNEYGYTSMSSFLFNGVWAHFFDKEIKL